jgi:hypothetical protein
MLAKLLKVVPRTDLDKLAKRFGVADEPERSKRLDLEYALQSCSKRTDVARDLSLMVTRRLHTEVFSDA